MIFVGDDWAEDHHDVHPTDESGVRPASRRLPEGLAGIGELHQHREPLLWPMPRTRHGQ